MNKPMKHDPAYWGSADTHSDVLARIHAIGPRLQANADANDELGELDAETFDALERVAFNWSHILRR